MYHTNSDHICTIISIIVCNTWSKNMQLVCCKYTVRKTETNIIINNVIPLRCIMQIFTVTTNIFVQWWLQYVHYQTHLHTVYEQVQLSFPYLIASIGKKLYKSKIYHVPTQLLTKVSTKVSHEVLCIKLVRDVFLLIWIAFSFHLQKAGLLLLQGHLK